MKLSYLIAVGALLTGIGMSAPAAAQHHQPAHGHPPVHRAAPHRPAPHHVVHRPAPRYVAHRPVHNWQWRHRKQHRVCRPVWRNHHRQQTCFWVNNRR